MPPKDESLFFKPITLVEEVLISSQQENAAKAVQNTLMYFLVLPFLSRPEQQILLLLPHISKVNGRGLILIKGFGLDSMLRMIHKSLRHCVL